MGKFAKTGQPARPRGVAATTTSIRTHEGGAGFAMDARTELFTLAVSNFVSESTFYEAGAARDARYVQLIHQLAATPEGCDWLAAFIPWLRDEAHMRSAATVAAVEYARTAHAAAQHSGRVVIATTLTRADEPAEALAYFITNYGKRLPAAVKRGIADAATRLYNEYSVIKYDPATAAVRLGDVIEITHPKPRNMGQATLFKYALDVRHGRKDPRIHEMLTQIRALRAWHASPTLTDLPNLVTWEQVSSHFRMDVAAWEAVIPKMGYMALLRNLRNFEEAGVSKITLDEVARKLADPTEVMTSRQLPFRFWNAYTAVKGTRFLHPLEEALEASVTNVPTLRGRTLILIDTSGSMSGGGYTRKGSLTPVQAAALFGSVVARRSTDARTFIFATSVAEVEMPPSALRATEQIVRDVGTVGHGTEIDRSLSVALAQVGAVDRVFIFTDMQAHPSRFSATKLVPLSTPIHVWDLSGTGRANLELGSGRYLHAGLSDQSFKTIALLEAMKPGVWPWEV